MGRGYTTATDGTRCVYFFEPYTEPDWTSYTATIWGARRSSLVRALVGNEANQASIGISGIQGQVPSGAGSLVSEQWREYVRTRSGRWASVTVTAFLALTGCSDSSNTEETPGQGQSQTAADGGTAEVRPSPRPLAKATYHNSLHLQASADYLVRKARKGWVVEDRGNGEIVHAIPVERDGKKLNQVVLNEDWLVWMYGGTPTVPPSLVVAQLPDGDEVSIGDDAALPAQGLPSGYVVDQGLLSYTSQAAGPTSCAIVVDLASMTAEQAGCAPSPEHGVGKAHATPFGAVFNQWSPTPEPQGCVGLKVRGADGDLSSIPAQRRCAPWSGVAGADFIVWSEPSGRDLDRAQMYGLDSGGEVTALGEGETSTERLCGDAVYWNATVGEIGEIRRWQPGEEVKVVYRMPETGVLIHGAISCDHDSLYFKEGLDGPDRVSLLELPLTP